MSNTNGYLLTAILRSYGRPIRTKRMLDCIFQQNMTGVEVLFMGDNCPHFKSIIKSDWFLHEYDHFKRKGNSLFWLNAAKTHNDWGAHVTNVAIKIARGRYTIFLDNDDKILPEHFQFYFNSIDKQHVDFVANMPLVYNGGMWYGNYPGADTSAWKEGSVGHCHLIINTEFLKTMPPHEAVYGQDWKLVQHMMAAGKGATGKTPFSTYQVMSIPGKPEPGFEDDK